ncbi:hypothetical protein RIF29_37491 [Crotalaria pallida]|uniref:Angio-associated migratory cell protein n=1 Tax=Crotalaria pallida TaxID=3830 RepID=A0AAN9EHM6_CROPI
MSALPIIHHYQYDYEYDDDNDDDDQVFCIDESDIIDELSMDDEDLPDADSDDDSVQDDDDVVVVDVDVDDAIHTFTRHQGELFTVACNPTHATLVATGGRDHRGFLWEIDGIVKVWVSSAYLQDAQARKDLIRGIEWLKWHPRQHKLLAGFEDSNAWMWNKDNEISPITYLTGHGSRVTCGDFTPDGGKICTGSADKTLRIWNSSGEIIKIVEGHGYHTEGLACLAISSTSTLALTGSEDGSACFVNIGKGRVISSLASSPSCSIKCVGFSPSDSSLAAIGGMDKRLVIWDIQHSLSRDTCAHEAGVTCLAWVGSWCVATGCKDGIVRLWDIRSGESVETFRGHSGEIQSLSVSANGDYIVSVSLKDPTARVFDVGKFK